MRRYGRLCLLLMIVTACAWWLLPIALIQVKAWLKYSQATDINNISALADNSLVYLIKPKQWLTFTLPEENQQLRIITNAHIQFKDTAALDPNWAYAIVYEFLDKQGKVLSSGVYHQRSHLTAYKNEQGNIAYNNYYLNNTLIPLDGRLILLGLQGMKKVAAIRLSLADNPSINEAAVRVYVPAKIAEQQLTTEWLRMGQTQKENLAKNSIYPASLLSLAEKKNLVRHQWQPVGPTGIEGKNYHTLTLYSLKNKTEEIAIDTPQGIQADAQHYAVIALPEQGGQIDLSFAALDGSVLTTPVELNLQWRGRDLEQRWQQDAVWSNDLKSLSYQLTGGLLLIRPSSPVLISASLTSGTEPSQDLSENTLSIKAYHANPAIDFNILHYQQQASALRIDVRRMFTAAQPQQGSVQYQWLNEQQQIIASGELNALEVASQYDRIGNLADGINVSDPASYYFNLPPEISKIRLSASSPDLLVSVYNQPAEFTKVQRIPEDNYVAQNADTARSNPQLTWFPLKSANDKKLMEQQAIVWVISQHHPTEDDPDVLAGRYSWQDFMPEGTRSAQYILTDYTEDEPRTDALPSVYCTLAINQDRQIKLNAFTGLHSVSPELIYLRKENSPFHVELFTNQQKKITLDAMGQQGVLRLPETALGNQHIRLNTNSGGKWLMNYQSDCQSKKYLKRRVFAITRNNPLSFVVQHAHADEILTARLFSPTKSAQRSQIKVEIVPITDRITQPTVTTRWTPKNRLYDIRPLPTQAIPVLYLQRQLLTNGERFSIPLNSDLAAGIYQINITLINDATGYIMLSQIKGGLYEQRRFYRENGLEMH